MIRVFMADDHDIVREGIRRILQDEPDVEVVGEARDGEEVIRKLGAIQADVILLDISMPGPGFKQTIRAVKDHLPRVPVVVLSIHPEEGWAVEALRAGASGYLTKGHSSQELTEAIRRVHEGGRYVTASLAELLAQEVVSGRGQTPENILSARELQVLKRLGVGATPKKIARELSLSPKTISTYRARILKKLGLRTNADLVRFVIEHDP